MFTGIVETTVQVLAVQHQQGGARLTLDLSALQPGLKEGDSLAVDGVCLTAAAPSAGPCDFDIIRETLQRSTLGELQVGRRVNVERSLTPSDRLDGHYVQGHVDGVGTVDHVQASAEEWLLWLAHEPHISEVVIPKGSIAINGASLTIAAAEPQRFAVALIPTTIARTNLGDLQGGDQVNIETDILARTVVHQLKMLLQPGALGDLGEVLQRHGFA